MDDVWENFPVAHWRRKRVRLQGENFHCVPHPGEVTPDVSETEAAVAALDVDVAVTNSLVSLWTCQVLKSALWRKLQDSSVPGWPAIVKFSNCNPVITCYNLLWAYLHSTWKFLHNFLAWNFRHCLFVTWRSYLQLWLVNTFQYQCWWNISKWDELKMSEPERDTLSELGEEQSSSPVPGELTQSTPWPPPYLLHASVQINNLTAPD